MTPQISPDFWAELRRRVAGDVKNDLYSRTLYSTDASNYQVQPLGVFFPRNADDIQAATEIAAKYRVPVLVRGGGTSLAGQAVNEALIMDASRHMTRVLEVNTDEKWARVQPGLVLDHLNDFVAPHGLKYGPDPASSNRATLGGIVGNNSTGSHSIVYGMTADHILRTDVVLSDGSTAQFTPLTTAEFERARAKNGLEGDIYRGLAKLLAENEQVIADGTPSHWRRCGGYNVDRLIRTDTINLAKLMVGAESTLGAVTEITLNLVEKPNFTALAVVHFDTVMRALEAVPLLLETNPSAVELIDELALRMSREVPEYARQLTFLEGTPNAILVTEYTGNSAAEVKGKLDTLDRFLEKHRIGTANVRAETAEMQANVWAVRKNSLGLLMRVKGDYKPLPFIEDSAVPVEHLPEYVSQIQQICTELDTKLVYYAHASAGCLHIRPLVNLKTADGIEKMERISRAAAELVAGYDGAWSSEHGDGRARSYMNEHFYGKALYGVYKQVKTLFDPHNLFNPGNIVDAGPMTEHLRYGADYRTIEITPYLNWAEEGGFAAAIEACNGSAVCRKDTGNMCPSYMATRDEEHSTRGRANLLRSAMAGRIPHEELFSERMYGALDLCVECKSCKSECPSSVDMAKIKTEFMAHYYESHPIPLRSRIFADFGALSRLASGPHAPLVNWFMRQKWVRRAMEKMVGIDHRREMPAFARQSFVAWFRSRRDAPPGTEPRQPVVLLHDTVNTYNHPEVSIAATRVLEAAGYRVLLPGHKDVGRPAISKGMLNLAKALANDTLSRLEPFARDGIPIIGLEPSDVSALKDDYFSMLPDNPVVKLVADVTVTFEEFMASLADDPNFSLPVVSPPRKILLHGHCHQKALIGTAPAKKALSLLGDVEIEELDAGCCGMAGSFGYETEHYDISMAMGERVLFPAVRRAEPDRVVVAAGVSCQHQIAHGTHRDALHPAQVFARAMGL